MEKFFDLVPLAMGQGGAAGSAGAGGQTGQLVSTFVTFGLVILIFYFLIIRPQNKKQKETEKMLTQLKKGDKIVTIGGVYGTVQSVKDKSVIVKVDENTKIEFSRSAISSVVNEKEEKAVKGPKGGKEPKAVEGSGEAGEATESTPKTEEKK